MENNFHNILARQQELEALKASDCPSRKHLKELRKNTDSPYSRTILNQCMHIYSQIRLQNFFRLLRKIPAMILVLFIVLTVIAELKYIMFYRDSSTSDSGILSESASNSGSDSSDDLLSDSPLGQLGDAIVLHNDFEEAHRIIDEYNLQPDTFATSIYFSEIYVHDQEYDQAADVVITFINDTYGTRNISEYSPLYKQLVQVSQFDLSPDVRKRCDSCLKSCRESVARLAAIFALIDTERYDVALELCDAEHRDGTYYSVLFESYNTCYTKLERYEDYADFLIKMAKLIQKEGDVTLTLPDKFRIQHCMKNIYPHLSEETQEEIDALNFL